MESTKRLLIELGFKVELSPTPTSYYSNGVMYITKDDTFDRLISLEKISHMIVSTTTIAKHVADISSTYLNEPVPAYLLLEELYRSYSYDMYSMAFHMYYTKWLIDLGFDKDAVSTYMSQHDIYAEYHTEDTYVLEVRCNEYKDIDIKAVLKAFWSVYTDASIEASLKHALQYIYIHSMYTQKKPSI